MISRIKNLYFFNKIRIKQKIRNLAVDEAERNLIKYGKDINDLSLEQWMSLVADEEDKIKKAYAKNIGSGLLISLGISPWL